MARKGTKKRNRGPLKQGTPAPCRWHIPYDPNGENPTAPYMKTIGMEYRETNGELITVYCDLLIQPVYVDESGNPVVMEKSENGEMETKTSDEGKLDRPNILARSIRKLWKSLNDIGKYGSRTYKGLLKLCSKKISIYDCIC